MEDSRCRSPLSYAATCCTEICELLLQSGAHPDTRDRDGRSILPWAAAGLKVPEAVLLLERNVEVDSQDKDGRTPLSWAAAQKFYDTMIRLLLEKGVRADCPDKNGRTPLSWAVTGGRSPSLDRDEVVTLLLERGADPNARDNQGRSPFYWAALCGHKSAAELLLGKDADRHLGDFGGFTPLSVAKDKGWDRVVKLILGIQDDPEIVYHGDPDSEPVKRKRTICSFGNMRSFKEIQVSGSRFNQPIAQTNEYVGNQSQA